jgi:hypothetical protein
MSLSVSDKAKKQHGADFFWAILACIAEVTTSGVEALNGYLPSPDLVALSTPFHS